MFENPGAAGTGTCKEFFSVASGTSILFEQGNYKYLDDEARYLCKTGYATKAGICATGKESLRKGKSCTSEADCTSSGSNDEKGNCCCGWNGDGSKICDILGGDKEW